MGPDELRVSIPFKRESGFKPISRSSDIVERLVSIPFKRESGFKPSKRFTGIKYGIFLFQFPSNGKVDSNLLGGREMKLKLYVSIPFKRESGFKLPFKEFHKIKGDNYGFNSLQTGKWIQTVESVFPVSTISCFNSLQTGKWIQTENTIMLNRNIAIAFQFPSNGKVDSNFKIYFSKWRKIYDNCFNSLQTGKWIQTLFLKKRGRSVPLACVSIPFKRESGFKPGASTLLLCLG